MPLPTKLQKAKKAGFNFIPVPDEREMAISGRDVDGNFVTGNQVNAHLPPSVQRTELSEAFVNALLADFKVHGAAAIEEVRKEAPSKYVEIILKLVPKNYQIENNTNVHVLPDLTEREVKVISQALDDQY